MKFSANLGFLWTDLTLPDAVHAAHRAGFDAVELHWPYDTPAADLRAALEVTGLPVLGLNTRRGDVAGGENGLAALPGREAEARAAIDEALDYAATIGAGNVHVMCGFAKGATAHRTFVANLGYACRMAAPMGITILIEPLNQIDAPGYFLQGSDHAVNIMDEVGAENLKLMYDCYHAQRTEGELTGTITRLLPRIGHVQFASVPDRGTPDHGEVNYAHIFAHLAALGYDAPLGAEYKPVGPTGDSLGWMKKLR